MLYVFNGSQGGWYVVDDVPGPNGFRRFASARFVDRADAEAEALRLADASGVGVATVEDCLGTMVVEAPDGANANGKETWSMATTNRTYRTFGYLARDGVTVESFFHANADSTVSWDHANDDATNAACKVCGALAATADDARNDAARVDAARGRARELARDAKRTRKDDPETVHADATSAHAELVDAMAASIAEETENDAARVAMLARIAETEDAAS